MNPAEPIVTPLPSNADPTVIVPLALQIARAIEREEYAVAAGFVLMLATFGLTRLEASRSFVPKKYTATALLLIAVLGGFGSALATGMNPERAAMAFLLCSSSAIAFWEGVAKHAYAWWKGGA